jgi:hypothetical protein
MMSWCHSPSLFDGNATYTSHSAGPPLTSVAGLGPESDQDLTRFDRVQVDRLRATVLMLVPGDRLDAAHNEILRGNAEIKRLQRALQVRCDWLLTSF